MKSVTPTSIAPPFGRYAHGIEVPSGARLMRSSGQLGLAPDGNVPSDAFEQAQICFGNITEVLRACDMRPEHVFHLSAFVTDRAFFPDYMRARDTFLADNPVLPTSTLLIVSGFSRPEFKVEVEAWAAAPDR